MAGYSSRPLVQKLGVKAHARVLFVDAPSGFVTQLGELPAGVEVFAESRRGALRLPFDFGLLFMRKAADLKRIAPAKRNMSLNGMLWIAWPKKAAEPASELSFEKVQRAGLDAGLVDTKICAIDDYWSGLKFVIPLKSRNLKR